jgi:hypothetical protein
VVACSRRRSRARPDQNPFDLAVETFESLGLAPEQAKTAAIGPREYATKHTGWCEQ